MQFISIDNIQKKMYPWTGGGKMILSQWKLSLSGLFSVHCHLSPHPEQCWLQEKEGKCTKKLSYLWKLMRKFCKENG